MANRTGLRDGFIRLRCDDPRLDLTAQMGEGAPRITAGLGGWDITARPRQVGMTTWAGVEPFQVQVDVLLDGYPRGASIEAKLSALVAVARGDSESEPGLLTVQGLPLPAKRWVIEGLDYADGAILLPKSAARARQLVTLTLREYVPPSYLHLRKHATQGSAGKTKVVRSKKGDTPAKVALRQGCKWTALRDLNVGVVRTANQHLPTNTKLRVPVAKTKGRKPTHSGTAHANKHA